MNKEELLEEIRPYSDDDLRLIIKTQRDLYSPDEMAIIDKELQRREEKRQQQIFANLPKEIICPKCDGINPFEKDFCQFCGSKLDKRRYYKEDWEEEIDNESSSEDVGRNSYAFHYGVSFLIPLIGFIVGAIMLGKDSAEQRSVGKICIILGILSIVGIYILWSIVIGGALFFIR